MASDEEVEFHAGEDSSNESFNEEEWIQLSEEAFDEEVQTAIQEGDEHKLDFLFKTKEKRCKLLQEEVDKTSKEEKAKKKRLKEWEEKFKKLNKTESALNKSLASSRSSTPATTPEKKPRASKQAATGGGSSNENSSGSSSANGSSSSRTGKRRAADSEGSAPKRHSAKFDFTTPAATRGELDFLDPSNNAIDQNQLLNSVLDLRQGKTQTFNELIGRALEAADNVKLLKFQERTNRCNCVAGTQVANNRVTGLNTDDCDTLETINTANNTKENRSTDVACEEGRQQLLEMLTEFKNNKSRPGKAELSDQDKLLAAINNLTEKMTALEMKPKDSGDKEGKKKLVSGKITKPDESDIKKQVKYAHEKLDMRHARERVFDKLNFSLLVAGELEWTMDKSHPGKWKGKKVTKWHVCRKCLKNGSLRQDHTEKDAKCPNKEA